MGGWGFYDHENDGTLDAWGAIFDDLLPDRISGMPNSEERYQMAEEWARTHRKELYISALAWIQGWIVRNHAMPEPDMYVSGVALQVADFLAGRNRKTGLPHCMPHDYPRRLKVLGLAATRALLDHTDENRLAWTDNKKRKKHLQEQERFFQRKNDKKCK